LAAPTFVPAGFCQLITVFAQIAIPLFVREFLRILEENPGESVTRKAMPFASLIFLAAVTNAFGNHRQRHLATKSGVILRSALVSSIYHHSLRLLPSGRAGLTSGQVTNLVAVDTQKVFEVTQEGHLIWSCPLSMVLVTILLLLILGPTALVGVVVLFSFVPAVERVVRAMIVTRKKRVAVSDERVEIINAMLQGMKVVKLNNYEARYQERIEEARNRELVYLRKELFIWALTLCLTVLTPVLASAATFATYVLVDDSNVLTVSTTFTTLLLFSALRFPINYGGRLIGKAAQAVDAIRRISEFMTRETGSDIKALQENAIDTDESNIEAGSSDVLLEVKNGMFAPGAGMTPTSVDEVERFVDEENAKDEEKMVGEGVSSHVFTLSNMNFEVSSGQILAVVGAVGSGKSTLCNAIVGEVTASPESQISCRGKLAFASQIPFILSASFRENILFGLPYEESRYEQVLDACCLRPDIEQIGGAGDLTEIGERGVTLSGGK
jgi:ABC-type multidrug transport system fused ATPase/permease subunit